MWLYMVALALLVLGIIGGAFMGGIFTIVLIPIAVIVAAGAAFAGASGRAAQGGPADTEATRPSSGPLPRHRRSGGGQAPTTPEGLVDARRRQQ